MPERETIRRAQKDKREGKSPSTQAGEFVREEIHHVREGKHGARSAKQAIAIGLSKARRAGVRLPAPKKGEAPAETRKSAKRALASGRKKAKRPSARRAAHSVGNLGVRRRSAHFRARRGRRRANDRRPIVLLRLVRRSGQKAQQVVQRPRVRRPGRVPVEVPDKA